MVVVVVMVVRCGNASGALSRISRISKRLLEFDFYPSKFNNAVNAFNFAGVRFFSNFSISLPAPDSAPLEFWFSPKSLVNMVLMAFGSNPVAPIKDQGLHPWSFLFHLLLTMP